MLTLGDPHSIEVKISPIFKKLRNFFSCLKTAAAAVSQRLVLACKKATHAATTLREGGSGDERGQVPVVSDSHRLSHTLSVLVNKETRRRSVNEGGLGDGAGDQDMRVRKTSHWWFVKGGGPGNPDWSAPCPKGD